MANLACGCPGSQVRIVEKTETVITSYSIHYAKLYEDRHPEVAQDRFCLVLVNVHRILTVSGEPGPERSVPSDSTPHRPA